MAQYYNLQYPSTSKTFRYHTNKKNRASPKKSPTKQQHKREAVHRTESTQRLKQQNLARGGLAPMLIEHWQYLQLNKVRDGICIISTLRLWHFCSSGEMVCSRRISVRQHR